MPESMLCPECKSPLYIDEHAETEIPVFHQRPGTMPYVEMHLKPVIVGACSNCEYVIEINTKL